MSHLMTRTSLLVLPLAIVLTATDASARNWAYTYNSLGLIETVNGPRTDVQDVTSCTYDAKGRQLSQSVTQR